MCIFSENENRLTSNVVEAALNSIDF